MSLADKHLQGIHSFYNNPFRLKYFVEKCYCSDVSYYIFYRRLEHLWLGSMRHLVSNVSFPPGHICYVYNQENIDL